ncbi:MAG: hypothetical protein KKB51_04595 [Candidatus Riflebacteria bacterium]|nr:hypothetical protein [Candidatus Riflebacteria bacterium]
MALLLYQISAVVFAVAVIFFMLELELREGTAVALKPFNEASEISEKKSKIEAVKLPTPPKAAKNDPDTKQTPKKSPIRGQTADFRAALWGGARSRIVEEEKAELLNDSSAYNLDYIDRISNFDTVIRYDFSSSRLIAGRYIFFGHKCQGLEQLDLAKVPKIGESADRVIQSDFAIFPIPRNTALCDLQSIEQFFSETYSSLVFQLGEPLERSLGELDASLSAKQKVESVMAHNRIISYCWNTPESVVNLEFAAFENIMYLCINYQNPKTAR